MKKFILLTFLLSIFQFISPAQTEPVVIEIEDETLRSIDYHQKDYSQPVRIVFSNLTSVTYGINFSYCTNLVAVDFPLLNSTGNGVTFRNNENLETISAPELSSIIRHLQIIDNPVLSEINICNLSTITLSPDELYFLSSTDIPTYEIARNNSSVDVGPFCFTRGVPTNLTLNNITIVENASPNTVVGILSADANSPGENLTYYLSDEINNDLFANDLFKIDNNTLVSKINFDYETQSEYEIIIGVFNQIGEFLEETFIINIEDVANEDIENEDIQVVEILDETLDNIQYYNEVITQPTRLIFSNLTSVSGDVQFYDNFNLVAVEFPLLTSVKGRFTFSGNEVLELIDAPVLQTIYGSLTIRNNTVLNQLNICNLSDIYPNPDFSDDYDFLSIPYYSIENNTSNIDAEPFCFLQGGPPTNLTLSNNTVQENAEGNTVIGSLSAEGNSPNERLTYYIAADIDLDYTGIENFDVIDNELVTKAVFDFETQSEYEIIVGVYNQLGEKTEETFTITIEDIENEEVVEEEPSVVEYINDDGIQVIEIRDETLEEIRDYSYVDFDQPTMLFFPNLISVSESIYFRRSSNLVAIDFPVLSNSGTFYFAFNPTLETINAPLLEITGNVEIFQNASLIELNICNLAETGGYSIRDNTTVVDAEPFCFSIGAPQNLYLSNTSIQENLPAETVVGILSAEGSNETDSFSYYMVDGWGFYIENNALISRLPFDYESQNEYELTIGVYNQMGERTTATFTIIIEDVTNEDIQVIEILDETLDRIYYRHENYSQPTRLVFPNLTSVSSTVTFKANTNLMAIDLPVLSNVSGIVTFSGNNSLESINAPVLETVYREFYILDNTALTELNICNLSRILTGIDESAIPRYVIKNNTDAVDTEPFCFSLGAPENLSLSSSIISENLESGSVIGDLSAESVNPENELTYYLTSSNLFNIVDNTLVTNTTFNFESQSEYEVTIGVHNQLGENIEQTFTITIEDVVTEEIQIVEILEEALYDVNYFRENFSQPTQLVFPNLTTVLNNIYFRGNKNLVAVDFPQLNFVGGYVSFSINEVLETINAPALETIHKSLDVYGHPSLLELNICNLTNILPYDEDVNFDLSEEPYYSIVDNPVLDFSTTCLENTDVSFNEEDTLIQTPGAKISLGSFEGNTNASISYFIIEEDTEETENEIFAIEADELYLNKDISEYEEDIYKIKIGALIWDNNENTSLNQKMEMSIEVDIAGKQINNDYTTDVTDASTYLSQNRFELYPNPASDKIYVQISNTEIQGGSWEIINLQGKTVLEGSISKINNEIDIATFNSGLYFLKVFSEDEKVYSQPFIVK